MLDANTARPSVYELLMMNSHPIHQGALEIVLPTSNNWVCPNEGQQKWWNMVIICNNQTPCLVTIPKHGGLVIILWNWKIRIFRPDLRSKVFASASGGSFRTQRSSLLVNRSSKRPKLVAGTLQYVISMENVPFIDSPWFTYIDIYWPIEKQWFQAMGCSQEPTCFHRSLRRALMLPERCRIGSMEHGLRNWVLEINNIYIFSIEFDEYILIYIIWISNFYGFNYQFSIQPIHCNFRSNLQQDLDQFASNPLVWTWKHWGWLESSLEIKIHSPFFWEILYPLVN